MADEAKSAAATEPDSQNAPHHTEGTPAAQGTAALASIVTAQNKFLAMLNLRMTQAEGLGLLALDFPETKQAAAESYGTLWRSNARRCFLVVTRIKRRMSSLPTT